MNMEIDMKIHQSGDKIIVTELNPVCDLNEDHGDVLIFIQEGDEVSCFCNLRLTEDGCLTDDQEFNFMPEEIGCIGWLPKPIYQPESKVQDQL